MEPRDFVYWLQGFFEISESTDLTPKQVQIIKDHLALVFKKETPDRSQEGEWPSFVYTDGVAAVFEDGSYVVDAKDVSYTGESTPDPTFCVSDLSFMNPEPVSEDTKLPFDQESKDVVVCGDHAMTDEERLELSEKLNWEDEDGNRYRGNNPEYQKYVAEKYPDGIPLLMEGERLPVMYISPDGGYVCNAGDGKRIGVLMHSIAMDFTTGRNVDIEDLAPPIRDAIKNSRLSNEDNEWTFRTDMATLVNNIVGADNNYYALFYAGCPLSPEDEKDPKKWEEWRRNCQIYVKCHNGRPDYIPVC